MAIYHLSIKMISRSSGRSVVAAAAYRAGEKLKDEELGKIQDYTRKGGVIMSEIMLPKYASGRLKDRETLWNEVQRVEKSSNSQLAREVEVALPIEMTREEQVQCIREFIRASFVSEGMIADWALHDKESENPNPHVHILLSVRGFTPEGTWDKKKRSVYLRDEKGNKIPEMDPKTGLQKVRVREGKGEEKLWKREYIPSNDWNDRSKAEEWRKSWADHCNRYLAPDKMIDHRSFERRGLNIYPTMHEGVTARKIMRKGKISSRHEENILIKEHNRNKAGVYWDMIDLLEYMIQKARDMYDRIQRLGSRISEISRERGFVRATREAADRDRGVIKREQHTTEGKREPSEGYREFEERTRGVPEEKPGILYSRGYNNGRLYCGVRGGLSAIRERAQIVGDAMPEYGIKHCRHIKSLTARLYSEELEKHIKIIKRGKIHRR